MRYYNYLYLSLIATFLISCSGNGVDKASQSITENGIKEYIAVLASDDFHGRFPGTLGEERTIHYLSEQFSSLGLLPGNGDSYFQEVPLMKITPETDFTLNISGKKGSLTLQYGPDFIGGTPTPTENVNISGSDLIFVGYGINAPEYQWNDYEGLDVRGKTVVMLVNDPGYATQDSALFTGNAMTYYGRWVYKYEEAARQGAAAAILVHETKAASYPWGVVENSFKGTKFYLTSDPITKSELLLQSWITNDNARKLFQMAGLDFDATTQMAAQRGFKPIEMKLKASASYNNRVEYMSSNNVIALLPGSSRKDEYIIYTAHWDHLGVNPALEGDSIFNGALDNASGTAALLEIAKAFKSLGKVQDRSILFMSVTCEEQGLLGSQYYAENPIYPLNKTVAVINMDAINIFGRTHDMAISGYGYNELDDYAKAVIESKGRYIVGDSRPESGGYYRSDHFSFAKVGVPSINISFGTDNVEHGKEWAETTLLKWIMDNYHKPSDNYEPETWKFDGMVEDVQVYFELGYKLSTTDHFPNWREGTFYKPIRDAMMK